MDIENYKFEEEEDVVKFVADLLWFFDVTYEEYDVEEHKIVNEILSICNGANKDWFDWDNPANYEDDGTYIYAAEIKNSPKMVYDIERYLNIVTDYNIDRVKRLYPKRGTTDEDFGKLKELEEECIEFCDDNGIDYVEIVLDKSAEIIEKEERWG